MEHYKLESLKIDLTNMASISNSSEDETTRMIAKANYDLLEHIIELQEGK